jgi:hypothetical protein
VQNQGLAPAHVPSPVRQISAVTSSTTQRLVTRRLSLEVTRNVTDSALMDRMLGSATLSTRRNLGLTRDPVWRLAVP